MSFHDTEIDVIRWAEANGEIPCYPHGRAVSIDSMAVLCDSIAAGDIDHASDVIGKIVIDLICLCASLDVDLTKSLEQAFARISAKPEKSNVVFLKQE